jgi:uncharacterized protein
MKANSEIINRIKQVIYSSYPNAEIFLFGSKAREDSNTKSDWDILILLDTPKITFNLEINIINELYEIEIETGEVISPLLYTKKKWNETYTDTPLFENIINEGIRL